MQFETALERLSSLPDPLPAPPPAIDAVLLGRLDQLPPWVRDSASAPPRDAAVLVLIYPAPDGEAHLVLTERPAGDLRHAGQVSFPGGAMDPGDDFPIGTALREAAEEVGLDPATAGVRVLGVLDSVAVRVSGFALVPVLAVAEREPVLVADQREVASILLAPVRHFLPDAPIEIVEAQRDGWRLRYGAYPVGRHQIWGATARVLGQLGATLALDARNPS
jgi:8-oxo-dGTP pyrophosphatase MutT (NUDIX family)